MTVLELLAPARNMEIGIAAIDCGADAVYIAGPAFGARKAAGNDFCDIAELCTYAHRFGARIFVTFNTIIRDGELEEAHAQMLAAQDAGADAFIIRDTRITEWDDIKIPLHASTQCAIRDVERARRYEALGCARIILERELPLSTVKQICNAVDCEVEFFVHGALCMCYSGDCRLSEYIDGRSADRGECIQACRSLYDLVDASGKVLVRNKALLSLKDYNLKDRLEDLAEAGISSFKIEGRLKNASYVKNVVRDYDLALNDLVARYPDKYCRASSGRVTSGFTPDTGKTFNRGYTELWLDGKRGKWSSMDAPKSMGEVIGSISKIRRIDTHRMELTVKAAKPGLALRNGDGFAFATKDGVTGFRGDICNGLKIECKDIADVREGLTLYRNINTAFERILDTQNYRREIGVSLSVRISGKFNIDIRALTEDGREMLSPFKTDLEVAENRERAEAMLHEQLSKRCGHYNFHLDSLEVATPGSSLPLLSASTINSMRRLVAEDLDCMPCNSRPLTKGKKTATAPADAEKISLQGELMRSKYCIRYELDMCPKFQGARESGPLYLLNNGRKFALGFDCKNCEMTLSATEN